MQIFTSFPLGFALAVFQHQVQITGSHIQTVTCDSSLQRSVYFSQFLGENFSDIGYTRGVEHENTLGQYVLNGIETVHPAGKMVKTGSKQLKITHNIPDTY